MRARISRSSTSCSTRPSRRAPAAGPSRTPWTWACRSAASPRRCSPGRCPGTRTCAAPPAVVTGEGFSKDLADAQEAWRNVIATATQIGIPVPGFSAALAYYDALRAERLPAALIQGLRDFFGAHTYRRTDRDGTFHT